MTSRHSRAWLLLAAGENRMNGSNAGYDDQVDVYYSWDSTVNNHGNIVVGDVVVLWDKKRLLGISVVEEIAARVTTKVVYRCRFCNRSTIKERKIKTPRYYCQNCKSEFDQPIAEHPTVKEYRSRHDAAWTSLDGLIDASTLRQLCFAPKSQLSMRALDWSRFQSVIEQKGEQRAIGRVLSRFDTAAPKLGASPVEFQQGHAHEMVRVRRGQAKFRDHLLATQGEVCAFTGSAPVKVLEAGHLYSYAKLGEHHPHGGLLLRRDVHRLFDDGSLAVDPNTLKVDVSAELEPYTQYARLHDQRLVTNLREQQVEWIAKHWLEHRGTATRPKPHPTTSTSRSNLADS